MKSVLNVTVLRGNTIFPPIRHSLEAGNPYQKDAHNYHCFTDARLGGQDYREFYKFQACEQQNRQVGMPLRSASVGAIDPFPAVVKSRGGINEVFETFLRRIANRSGNAMVLAGIGNTEIEALSINSLQQYRGVSQANNLPAV